MVSIVGEFFGELAQMVVRDGLIETGKWLFRRKEQTPLSAERSKVLSKREKDRRNRRRNQ